MIILPECFNSLYGTDYFREYAESLSQESQQILSETAKECNVFVVGGSIPEIEPETNHLYNTCCVYNPMGKRIATHRKLHLFDIDIPGKITFQESLVLKPGNDITFFDTPWGRFGLGICYDLRFPELASILAKQYGCIGMIYPVSI
jgi:omega-amidase